MRFVIIEGVVLNIEAIDMIVPHGAQSEMEISLRGGSTRVFNLSADEFLEHLRHTDDEIIRLARDGKNDSANAEPDHADEEMPDANHT